MRTWKTAWQARQVEAADSSTNHPAEKEKSAGKIEIGRGVEPNPLILKALLAVRPVGHNARHLFWNLEKPGSTPPVAVWRPRSRLERPDHGLKRHTPHHPPSGTLMGARGSLRTRSRLSEVIMPDIFSWSCLARIALRS